MADKLDRVQSARKEAFFEYLRQKTINELAVFVRDAFPHIQQALDAAHENSGIDKDNHSEQLKLEDEMFVAFRGISGAASVFHDSLIRSLKNNDPSLANKFYHLQDHFKEAHHIVDTYYSNGEPKGQTKDAETILLYLSDIYVQACERAAKMVDKLNYELDHGEIHPEVLVLQGGGAKGMAYSGVVEHLSDRGLLKDIKRVVGTSAGALMGLPVVMGCTSDEINEIVHNGRFAQFFAESTLKFKGLTAIQSLFGANTPSHKPYLEGHLLLDFSQHYFMPILSENTSIKFGKWKAMSEDEVQFKLKELESQGKLGPIYDKALSEFKRHLIIKGREQEIDVLRFTGLFTRSPQMQCALNCIRLSRSDNRPDSDIIEAFIGDVIQLKLDKVPLEILRELDPPISTLEDKRKLRFSQLEQLTTLYPRGGFKEFGVAITDSFMPVTPNNLFRFCGAKYRQMITYFSGDVPQDSGVGPFHKKTLFKPIFARAPAKGMDYVDMPIKKAVRASMNLPGVFAAMKEGAMRLVDGGLTNNFAQRMFVDKYESSAQAASKTIGFMLSALDSYIENKAVHKLIKEKGGHLDLYMDQVHQNLPDRLKKMAMSMGSPLTTFKSWAERFIGQRVDNLMSTHNTTMPSMDEMDNIGIINAGMVNTADFHLNRDERIQLHLSGKESSLNLSIDQDKHLRYALGRLMSLIRAEKKLIKDRPDDLVAAARLSYVSNAIDRSNAPIGSADRLPLSNVLLKKRRLTNKTTSFTEDIMDSMF